MASQPSNPPRGTSLYDFCQGVIAGIYTVKTGVQKKIDAGEYYDAADWASRYLTEWHPTKNGNLTPQQVAAGSDKKVWWQKNCNGVLQSDETTGLHLSQSFEIR